MELLKSRVESDYEKIKKFIKVKLNDNQIASILSFVYNVGIGAFKKSTLLKKINENVEIEEIKKEFMKWIYANGEILDGLKTRRKKEFELYIK